MRNFIYLIFTRNAFSAKESQFSPLRFAFGMAIIIIIAVGIWASNSIGISGLMPSTKSLQESLPIKSQAASSVSLSKEYIYVGGRLVAVEESAANLAPTNLVATFLKSSGSSTSKVSISWKAPPGTIHHYEVERSQSITGPFTLLTSNLAGTNFLDEGATTSTVFLYRVRAVFSGGGSSPYSNIDPASTFSFTDEPLNLNGMRTTIRAIHFTELREAVNSFRGAVGLPPFNWTGTSPATGGLIYASQFNDLRSSLAEALGKIGSIPQITAAERGTFVTGAPLQQLRDLMK